MQTSFYTLLCIVIRIVALAMALMYLVELPAQLAFHAHGNSPKLIAAAMLGSHVAMIVVAFVLWLYPGMLADLATTRAAREPFESSIDATDLQRIGFAVVGIWFVVDGFSDTLYVVGEIVGLRAQLGSDSPSSPQWPGLFAGISAMAAGGVLTLGSRGLARFLHTLRYGSPAQHSTKEET